ncbi:MAG TPA: hypothetical protein VEB21_07400 [Terriglobales bacterium]|nr:hypothetical protein [Terriglobales bacterium]
MSFGKITLIAGALAALFTASVSYAAGIGGHIEYAYSSIDLTGPEIEADRGTIGFTYDTDVARDTLFNYRLQAGYQFSSYEYESFNGDDEGHGLNLLNAFGFGIFRSPFVRVWAGPAIRFTVDSIDSGGNEFVDVSLGGGPIVGANFHVGPNLTLSPSIAYNYSWVGSYCDDCFGDDDETGDEHRISLNFAILFRTPDDFFGSSDWDDRHPRRRRY